MPRARGLAFNMLEALFRVLRGRVWSPGRVDALAGETVTALTKISDAFVKHQVEVGSGQVGWGQYLDESHFSHNHWGFYGTSAARQTLAIRALSRGAVPSSDTLVLRAALPTSAVSTEAVFEAKRRKCDFDNVVKLAFIADALELDEQDAVPDAETPAVVDELIALAISGERWTSRLRGDRDYGSKDEDFPTALVVSVLRRFVRFRRHTAWTTSRDWLANRVLEDRSFRAQRTLLALTALALLPHRDDPNDPSSRITRALETCEEELLNWVREQGRAVVLTRPVFSGFSVGPRTDYVFLHPELLTALFLLRRGSPPAGRAFVLDVLAALWRNVDRQGAFMGQDGMVTSVDQLWAARLIREFLRTRSDHGPSRVIPRVDSYIVPHSAASRAVWIGASLLIALGIAYIWGGIAALAVGAILVVVQVLASRR